MQATLREKFIKVCVRIYVRAKALVRQVIQTRFFWLTFKVEVGKFIRKCKKCQFYVKVLR